MRMLCKLVLFASAALGLLSSVSGLISQEQTAQAMLDMINQLRTANGLDSVFLNNQLSVAAQRHSDDMALNGFLGHTGSDDSQFWERITDAGYELTTAVEFLQVREDPDDRAAFRQWQNTLPNLENMLNVAYREVGIGTTLASSGEYYYTMILAARANFTPPSSTPLPAFTPAPLILTPLPATLPMLPTITPSSPPATMTPLPSPIPQIITPPPTLILAPSTTAVPASATSQPVFDVRLVYDTQSFALINTSQQAQFISGLHFESISGSFTADRWDNEFATASTGQLPSGGCFQIWSLNQGGVLPAPADCAARQGWLAVTDSQLFWENTDVFAVYAYDERVTVCIAAEGVCDFNLTDRLPTYERSTGQNVASPATQSAPQNPPSQGSASSDVKLVYSSDSFSIINTSGRDLDLNGLGFASASGILSISAWDTEFLTRPLNAFPSGDCLQAWPLELTEWPARPAECHNRHAWLGVNYTRTFWLDTDVFTASQNGVVLATCRVSTGVCEFDLPE